MACGLFKDAGIHHCSYIRAGTADYFYCTVNIHFYICIYGLYVKLIYIKISHILDGGPLNTERGKETNHCGNCIKAPESSVAVRSWHDRRWASIMRPTGKEPKENIKTLGKKYKWKKKKKNTC